MPLKECPVCKGKVATSAVTCPHCGHPVWTDNLRALRGPFTNRLKKMRAVGAFCVASILVSVGGWFGQWFFELLMLERSWGRGFPLTLLTYAFVHSNLFHLLAPLFWIAVLGGILEPRIGGRKTGAIILLAGALVPGLIWISFDTSGVGIVGSMGVFYAMVGAAVALWQRTGLSFPERALVIISIVIAVPGVMGAFLSPSFSAATVIGIPSGYAIVLALVPKTSPREA